MVQKKTRSVKEDSVLCLFRRLFMIFKKQNNITEIPVFFATDDNYAPYLGVALSSISKNLSPLCRAKIHVLTTSLSRLNRRRLRRCVGKNCSVSFTDVTPELEKLGTRLHLRDYYTAATYYRFFIADLFPEYDKALYLDCDIAVNGDISELYSTPLGDTLVGAIVEEVMQKVDIFGEYVERVLEMPREEYFNAGVLVMNLAEMRRINIKQEFAELLGKRRFAVTQDQDYLNVICYGRSTPIDLEWNKTPIPDGSCVYVEPKLVHYKINWKPWHYEEVLYGDDFWRYAEGTPYLSAVKKALKNYTDEQRENDARAYIKLCNLAKNETRDAALQSAKNRKV